jgi:hypothetical protein
MASDVCQHEILLVSNTEAEYDGKLILSIIIPFLLYFKRNGLAGSITYTPPLRENANERMRFLLFSTVLHFPGFKFMHFVKTPNFYPLGIAELQNRNIVIGGPTHLCGNTCKDDDCGIAKHSPGLLHVFKPTGEFLYEISVDASENTFLFPTYIAASSKADTIAVCDATLRKVIVLDYKGKVQAGVFTKCINLNPGKCKTVAWRWQNVINNRSLLVSNTEAEYDGKLILSCFRKYFFISNLYSRKFQS